MKMSSLFRFTSLVSGFWAVTLLSSMAAELPVVRLWPNGAPEKAGVEVGAEMVLPPQNGKGVLRVTNVADPTITVYRPEKPNGTAVIVCPGGGYQFLAIDHEGDQVCKWLNSLGVTGVLLKYRVPVRDKTPGFEPLQDMQRAVGVVRRHAAQWGIDPTRVGVLGFSAGGHLALMGSLYPNDRTYTADPTLDVEDATPNFVIPIYPGSLVDPSGPGTLLPSIRVTKKAPPMCLIHAHDDKGGSSSLGSALLYAEYHKLGLSAELHIFVQGGHGFGMRPNGKPVNEWPRRVAEWMGSLGLLQPSAP
ncbi:MAG: hypothetical protein RLZZ399_59 [Verrucomicrobiota bacterium]|jgi:acetyl esterase/lipase